MQSTYTTSARIWTDWIVFGSTAWTTAICVQIMAGALLDEPIVQVLQNDWA